MPATTTLTSDPELALRIDLGRAATAAQRTFKSPLEELRTHRGANLSDEELADQITRFGNDHQKELLAAYLTK